MEFEAGQWLSDLEAKQFFSAISIFAIWVG